MSSTGRRSRSGTFPASRSADWRDREDLLLPAKGRLGSGRSHSFEDAIKGCGLYFQPIGGIGLSRVDVRDIADAAVNALTQPEHSGAVYPLVGPDVCTGENTAATYSRHLGRQIRYAGDDLDAWFAQAATLLHPKQAEDYRIMYEHFQRFGLIASGEEFAEQTKVLGHPPRSFDTFVAEVAAMWKS